MAGYSEVIQTIGAMIIFSLVLLNGNRMMQRNNFMMVEGELEQETIALAEDIVEEARTKEFDENSMMALPPAKIPGDFTTPSMMGPDAGEFNRRDFDDFDDYHGYRDSVLTEQGYFRLDCEVTYVTPDTYDATGSNTTFKKLRVYVTSRHLKERNSNKLRSYYFEYIRNYYAD